MGRTVPDLGRTDPARRRVPARAPHPGWLESLCAQTADRAAAQHGAQLGLPFPPARGEGRTWVHKAALPLGHHVDSGDPGERQLRPSAVRFRPPTLGGEGRRRPSPARPLPSRQTQRPRGLSPVPALGRGCSGRSARHQRRSAFTSEHVAGPQVSAASHRPQGALVSVKAESSPPPHFQGGGCISEDRRRARALLPSLVLERGLRHRVPHTVLGPGTEETQRASARPPWPAAGRPALTS